MSEIQNWYTGKNVLITGGTGFIGKVVVERLLSDCENINSIYLIVRGQNNFNDRCKSFLNHMVFDSLRKSKPKQLEKIKIIQGDLTQIDIGLSNEDLTELENNIDIVIHAGATVRFDLALSDSFTTNTRGTYKLLELAKQIKKLQIFVFVSTAFSQPHQKLTEERHYDAVINPHVLKRAFDKFDEQTMLALQPKILDDFPNTYSFSKHLSEDLVYGYRDKIPICIVRPSVVACALKQPMYGYTEGINGPNGWSYASSRGVLRTIFADVTVPFHIIPVDIVANTIIATSWIHGTNKLDHIEYYNTDTSFTNLLTILQFLHLAEFMRWEYPANYSVWFPNNTLTSCVWYFYIRLYLYQIIPSALLDLLILMFRYKPIMLKIQRKLYHGQNIIKPYLCTTTWFRTDKFTKLRDYLNETDNEIFDTNIDRVSPSENAHCNASGMRKFICKELDEDLPRAKRNITMYELNEYWHVLDIYNCAMHFRILFDKIYLLPNFLNIYGGYRW